MNIANLHPANQNTVIGRSLCHHTFAAIGIGAGAMVLGGGLKVAGGFLKSPPKVPSLEKLDPMNVAMQTVQGNQKNLPAITELARSTTNAQQDILLGSLRKSIPRFDEIFGKESDVLMDQLRGSVPQDVQDLLARKSGAKAFSGGFGQGTSRSNLEARDLGLTSLQMIEQGTHNNWLQQAAALTTPTQFNISSMFLTPAQNFQMKNEQNVQQFQRSMGKNMLNNPYKAGNIIGGALTDMGGQFSNIGGGVLGAFLGGAAGSATGDKTRDKTRDKQQIQPLNYAPQGSYELYDQPLMQSPSPQSSYSYDPTYGSGFNWNNY